MVKKKNKIGRRTLSNVTFNIVNYGILTLLTLICLYPMLHVLFASVSDPTALIAHRGLLLKPLGFTMSGYQLVFKDNSLLIGFKNTFLYVGLGTLVNMLFTIMGAYALSRRDFKQRNGIMLYFVFTMYFSGGLVPLYMTISSLHLISTKAILIIIVAINTYNLIIARTFIANSIPEDLYEAAVLDGCSHFNYFLKVVLPLSKAVISVLILYYAVFHWNDYFNALMFNSNSDHAPLQIVLREILLLNQAFASGNGGVQGGYGQSSADQVKYAIIIVSTVPILCVYPFIQKYFEKGVMIGAVKG